MPLNGLFMFVWAGKDVANSESAGKLFVPHGLQQAAL
jgi:hypothetical protein